MKTTADSSGKKLSVNQELIKENIYLRTEVKNLQHELNNTTCLAMDLSDDVIELSTEPELLKEQIKAWLAILYDADGQELQDLGWDWPYEISKFIEDPIGELENATVEFDSWIYDLNEDELKLVKLNQRQSALLEASKKREVRK